MVLLIFYKADVTLNVKKCNFLSKKIDYFGPVTEPAKLVLADYTTDSIHGLISLRNVAELKLFIELCNV